ncbi:MAG: 3'(2'),5'-bisphosphate nucleotidase [Planctomycetota bacterium]
MSDYARELEVAREAVRAAVRLTARVQPAPERTLAKGDRSPVTVADFGAQALICAALAEAFPADPVIGEEDAAALRAPEGAAVLERVALQVQRERPGATPEQVCDWIDRGGLRAPAPRAWTLDPVDGTKGFLRREQYGVALALIVGGEVVLGALGCPQLPWDDDDPAGPRGVLAWAVRGQGAFAAPLAGGEPARLRVSARGPAAARQLESVEPSHHDQDRAGRVRAALGISAPPRRMDSMVKYVVVARGGAELYLRLTADGYRQKVWDHAAGALLVTEAGGAVTDLEGRAPDFGEGAELSCAGGLVVSNGAWHAEALAALRQA